MVLIHFCKGKSNNFTLNIITTKSKFEVKHKLNIFYNDYETQI